VQLAEGFSGPIHVVWGNNDGDKWLRTEQAARFGQVALHGELADLDLGGLHVAMTHYPQIARGLVAAGHYDLVCYGHDHVACDERVGPCRLLNPGELMGRLEASTFVILDVESGVVIRIEVENPHSI
jgi:predicted phosphodiesterase